MKKVQVLLSTYNGEKFVEQQIDSILSQTYPETTLLIRDDGSTDNTLYILKKFETMYPDRARVISESNIGVIKSFFALLNQSDERADYFCFCDQDDVWLPEKITRAVDQLNGTQGPAMIFTATQMTDSDLKPLKVWPSKPAREPSFYNALIQNIAVGATITLNKEARDLLCRKKVQLEHVLMHDWWAYICVSALGKVYFDSEPSILYRQHANNVVGGETVIWDTLKRKWRSFQKHKGKRLLYNQAKEFHRIFASELDYRKREQLELFIGERSSMSQRFRFLKQSKLYRQSFLEQTLFRFLILIGYI